jgi:hypothetical protein
MNALILNYRGLGRTMIQNVRPSLERYRNLFSSAL